MWNKFNGNGPVLLPTSTVPCMLKDSLSGNLIQIKQKNHLFRFFQKTEIR
jgi:hypothetical protein